MNKAAERVHPPTREQLLYWLHEASEIEHHLMCCYLYAAFSLKREEPRWSAEQRDAIARWRDAIMSVVFDEMTHLALVGNLASALGDTPHVGRPPFPVDAGPYPAGFVIRLQPFSAATIEHFKFLERPSSQELRDAEGFSPQREYRRVVPEGRLSPGPKDYATVGELYEVLAQSLAAWVAVDGEAAVFMGDPALQVDAALAPLTGVIAVTDLSSAQQAIATIVTQGEGAGHEEVDSRFCRFTRMGEELAALTAADPQFEPAWPAATNPVIASDAPRGASTVEVVEGEKIAVHFDAARCIHSRHCVLDAPTVFKSNTPGAWIFPDAVPVETLVAVAHNCPSGAIHYVRKDGGPAARDGQRRDLRGDRPHRGPHDRHATLSLRAFEEQTLLRRAASRCRLCS